MAEPNIIPDGSIQLRSPKGALLCVLKSSKDEQELREAGWQTTEEIFTAAFKAFEQETGLKVLNDWPEWEIWASAHQELFVGLSDEDLHQHLAKVVYG